MKRIRPLLLLFVAICLPLRGLAEEPAAAKNKAFDKITARMRGFVAEKQVSGVVTLVAHNGQVVDLQAVGQADIAHNVPMKTDALFCIASMTKPITATAVMILADEGKLSVDDPVAKYLPEFANAALKAGPPDRALTIRDLMTHTSGIVGDQQNQGSLEETAHMLAKRPLGFQPGTKWQYSPGLSVCGRLIEVVSGQPYAEFLQQRIFDPLGMTDTTFTPTVEQQARLVTLYKPSDDKTALVEESHWLRDLSAPRSPNPSGGLFSTAADMAQFYQMILDGGQFAGRRIISEASVREMTSVQTGELPAGFTPGCGWGYGWGVVREPQGVTKMLSPGTFGHGGAFGTQGWVDPHRKMIFVLMIQRSGFGNGDASEIRGNFQELAVEACSAESQSAE